MTQSEQKQDRGFFQRRMVLSAYEVVSTLITALIVFSLLFTYVFRVVGVKGDSMLPTLKDGEKLLLSASNSSFVQGDIVVVDRYTDTPLIKRVIAVGGDTISIALDGAVSVNGKVLKEPYIQGITLPKDFSGEETVPQGYLFVMGDNRGSSNDSRDAEIGLVSEKDVVGKAVCRVWPLRTFRIHLK